MRRIANAVGNPDAVKILAIAQGGGNADPRMEQILLLNPTFAAKTSDDWAELLGVTGAAIRQTPTWRRLRSGRDE